VQRILEAHQLAPHRVRTFKLSNDPNLRCCGRRRRGGAAGFPLPVGRRGLLCGQQYPSGTNAEFHLVDERIVRHKPRTLGFAEAAALPLTSITAWEALFDRMDIRKPVAGAAPAVLIIGGGGGVVELIAPQGRLALINNEPLELAC
jgi:hypothetical protein